MPCSACIKAFHALAVMNQNMRAAPKGGGRRGGDHVEKAASRLDGVKAVPTEVGW